MSEATHCPFHCHRFMKTGFYLFLLILLAACATVEKPSGGPVDKRAPKCVSAFPKDCTVMFTGNRIVLEFDEFISLKNPSSQVIMNPFSSTKPELSVQGKKVRIILKDSLLPNTTYHLFFGSAVQDITEGNPAAGLSYVFSTGKKLDSCSVSGFAGDAFNGQYSTKAWVMLFRNRTDFRDTLPVYIAHTDDRGAFQLRNVAPGKYFICALEDNNSNFKFDLPDEKAGFLAESIVLEDGHHVVDSVNLYLFLETPAEQKHLKSELIHYRTVRSAFRLPLNDPNIRFLSPKEGVKYDFLNEIKDTLIFWVPSGTDTLSCIINDGSFSDTINQALNIKSRLRNYSTDTSFTLKANMSGDLLNYTLQPLVSSNVPFQLFDSNAVVLSINNDTVPAIWEMADSAGLKWQLANRLKKGDECKLMLKKGAFRNFFGHINDSTAWKFSVAGSDELGSISLTLNRKPEGKLILFLNGKNTTQKRSLDADSSIVTMKDLLPGEYKMYIIEDTDNNGAWSTGDYDSGLLPEKVFILARPVVVKKGWTSKVQWDLRQR